MTFSYDLLSSTVFTVWHFRSFETSHQKKIDSHRHWEVLTPFESIIVWKCLTMFHKVQNVSRILFLTLCLKSLQSLRLSIVDRATLTALESSRATISASYFCMLAIFRLSKITLNPISVLIPSRHHLFPWTDAEVILAKNLTLSKFRKIFLSFSKIDLKKHTHGSAYILAFFEAQLAAINFPIKTAKRSERKLSKWHANATARYLCISPINLCNGRSRDSTAWNVHANSIEFENRGKKKEPFFETVFSKAAINILFYIFSQLWWIFRTAENGHVKSHDY